MQVPRHAVAVRGAGPLSWDAALGAAVLLVALLVAATMPTADLTLRTVHGAPSVLPGTSQVDGADFSRGRQDP